MKIFRSFFLLVSIALFAVGTTSCGSDDEELPGYNAYYEVEKFYNDIIAVGGIDAAQIVDYRSAEDYNQGHIPGAINIQATNTNTSSENSEFSTRIRTAFPDTSKPIFFYGGGAQNSTLEKVVGGRVSQIVGKDNSRVLTRPFSEWAQTYPDLIEY